MEESRESDIWQRVMAQPTVGAAPDGLLRESAALAAVYRRLSGTLAGRSKLLVQKLAETEQANTACLRGILTLSGAATEQVKHWEPGKGNTRKLLQSCYHRTRRCQAEYTACSLEPEFGEVYRNLAARAGEQCVRIAELLGMVN